MKTTERHMALQMESTRKDSDSVNADAGSNIVRSYRKTIESLTPNRSKGHKTFCEALKTIGISEMVIGDIRMAPSLYANDQEWLEWLWIIQQNPSNIPLDLFLTLSGSKVTGDTTVRATLDWKSVRGQEELVHKAIRVVYPKPRSADWYPWLLVHVFYLLSFPGSIIVWLLKPQGRCKLYIPYSTLWTVTGLINLTIAGAMYRNRDILIKDTDQQNKIGKHLLIVIMFSAGLVLFAGLYGIFTFLYRLGHLESIWSEEKSQNRNVKVLSICFKID